MAPREHLALVHRDEMERAGPWRLARRSLGLESFGLNLVELEPGAQIPEHDESARDQEEVFIVLRGSPTLVVDGQDHDAPEGTFARLDPERSRCVVNRSADPASVLIASAPRSSGYVPMDWA
jgi:uncharacterized cupin superfamily protein